MYHFWKSDAWYIFLPSVIEKALHSGKDLRLIVFNYMNLKGLVSLILNMTSQRIIDNIWHTHSLHITWSLTCLYCPSLVTQGLHRLWFFRSYFRPYFLPNSDWWKLIFGIWVRLFLFYDASIFHHVMEGLDC